jgi:hypothetical protein
MGFSGSVCFVLLTCGNREKAVKQITACVVLSENAEIFAPMRSNDLVHDVFGSYRDVSSQIVGRIDALYDITALELRHHVYPALSASHLTTRLAFVRRRADQ